MRIRRESELLDDEIELVATVSDALAHPVRIRIYQYVMQCNRNLVPVYNKTLCEELGYAQATISQHVKKLVDAGLLQTKKEDRYTMFYANIGMLSGYLAATRKFSVFEAVRPGTK